SGAVNLGTVCEVEMGASPLLAVSEWDKLSEGQPDPVEFSAKE
ncbi:MAG: hypothetical protein ACI9OJ_005846, partial [Myxococcota bacterium]